MRTRTICTASLLALLSWHSMAVAEAPPLRTNLTLPHALHAATADRAADADRAATSDFATNAAQLGGQDLNWVRNNGLYSGTSGWANGAERSNTSGRADSTAWADAANTANTANGANWASTAGTADRANTMYNNYTGAYNWASDLRVGVATNSDRAGSAGWADNAGGAQWAAGAGRADSAGVADRTNQTYFNGGAVWHGGQPYLRSNVTGVLADGRAVRAYELTVPTSHDGSTAGYERCAWVVADGGTAQITEGRC